MSAWELENMLAAGILGVLLMIYSDQRASRLQKCHPLAYVHLIVIYGIGMLLLAKLGWSLLSTMW